MPTTISSIGILDRRLDMVLLAGHRGGPCASFSQYFNHNTGRTNDLDTESSTG
ncbi:MAG TPA: hypothetical protein VFO86_09895 [Terriglobia bacterium]|nr:hypothetical protein [Terriglobia bacterium]